MAKVSRLVFWMLNRVMMPAEVLPESPRPSAISTAIQHPKEIFIIFKKLIFTVSMLLVWQERGQIFFRRAVMVRFYIRISGRVQGVGFRYFVAQTASLYSITGWVRNLEDGDVELEAQGIQEDIDAFIERVRQGNRYSQIYEFELHPLAPVEERKFRIMDWW